MAFLIAFFPFLISSLSFLIIYPTTLRAPQCNTIKITFLCQRVLFYELLTPCLPAVWLRLPHTAVSRHLACLPRRREARRLAPEEGDSCGRGPILLGLSRPDWMLTFGWQWKVKEGLLGRLAWMQVCNRVIRLCPQSVPHGTGAYCLAYSRCSKPGYGRPVEDHLPSLFLQLYCDQGLRPFHFSSPLVLNSSIYWPRQLKEDSSWCMYFRWR